MGPVLLRAAAGGEAEALVQRGGVEMAQDVPEPVSSPTNCVAVLSIDRE
jgi:hypothetical protein